MSRVLAELMGVAEPQFRQQFTRLERAAGLPGADIRLMMEVVNETRVKIRDLGLDPRNTTGPELYEALCNKLLRDEVQVRAALNMRADGSPLAVLEAVQKRLTKLQAPTQTFVVKQSVMRAMLKKLRPMATCRRLGYRSLDSMIKHEPAALLLAAASRTESRDWQIRRLEAYKKLRPRDFETRGAAFLLPAGKRWSELAAEFASGSRHSMLVVPELGAVVLTAPEHDLPGLAIVTLVLGVDSLNDLRSLSSYLKLQQTRSDFGEAFAQALTQEPFSGATFAGEALPWKALQWFYGNGYSPYHPDAFEPYIQPEDLSWLKAESVLASLHVSLEFWQNSQLLALLDNAGRTVSLNVLDVALAAMNGLDFSKRLTHHMRVNLGREFMARYLHHDNLQAALLLGQLDGQLMPEVAA